MSSHARVLVPIDGSAHAHNGLEVACILAGHYQAKVILLCVPDRDVSDDVVGAAINEGLVQPPSYQEFISDLGRPSIAEAAKEARRQVTLARVATAIADSITERGARFVRDQNVPEVMTLVRSGDPADLIVETAREFKADLVVMGSRGQAGLEALFDRSVADAVRRRAECPTLVLFPGDDDD